MTDGKTILVGVAEDTWDVFVSYASPDIEHARALSSALQPDFHVFLDEESVPLGLPFDQALVDALNSSRVTVVLISQQSRQAFYQREEVVRAIARMRRTGGAHRVVPVYLDGPVPAAELAPVVGVALLHGLSLAVDGLPRVAARLRALLAEAGTVAPPVPPAHPLHEFPAWGYVESHRIRRVLIDAVAERYSDATAALIVQGANEMRVDADPSSPEASIIRQITLPTIGVVGPIAYWAAVFTEAKLHGPRMLAALLLTVNSQAFPPAARNARQELLTYLKSIR